MPDVLSVVGGHRVLIVGFLLLQYSAVYTVESLSLFNLLFLLHKEMIHR